MTSVINFNALAGVTGMYQSNMELVVFGGDQKKIRQMLTMRNGKIAWRVSFLQKKLTYWKSVIANSDVDPMLNQPAFRESANGAVLGKMAQARAKIETIEAELAEIRPLVTEELFTDTDEGLVVPPGMWYLCQSIGKDEHLNTDMSAEYVDGLRPYQTEAIDALLQYKRAMVELATGLGKSKIIHSLAKAAIKAEKRIMIVVPTEYLVGQMLDQLKALEYNVTAQGGGRLAEGGWDVLVTTIQSASGFADLPDVVVFDETHHISAESWTNLAMSLSKATHVYGMTATAFRSDGLDAAIHSFIGPIVYSRDVRWGIQNGWLSEFTAFSITVNPKKNGRKVHFTDTVMSTTAYKVLVPSLELMTIARDRLLAGIAKDRKIIVVFKTVEACKAFKKFCEGQVDMAVASAQNGQKSKAPLRRFQKGDSKVLLVNSGLISEGVDIPDADLLIQCCQNSSDVMTLQMLGRILRKPEGKKRAVIIDLRVNGYDQFVRAGERRAQLYRRIAGNDNIKEITVE